MIAIITEKPSVAKDIARIFGVSNTKKGYMEGNGYLITWAYGHLLTQAMPQDYGRDSLRLDDLPLIPDPFKLVVRKVKTKKRYQKDAAAQKQLDVIKGVFAACERIIVATDAGREGELIFRWIYEFLKCKKPFFRLWISSMTDAAIRDGFENIKEGRLYDSLYLAAQARAQADWLLGINASRALSLSSGETNHSLGRVQTPTLALICKRYAEHTNFIAKPFWQLLIHVKKEDRVFLAQGVDVFSVEQEAQKQYQCLKGSNMARVSNMECKETKLEPPLLHDLTSLQKAANSKYGLTAEQTLTIAQKLYEQKWITYPRTGSRYIPKDVFEMIPSLIEVLKLYPTFSQYATLLSAMKLNKNSVDDKKITDHHALLITSVLPKKLDENEKLIYELIAGRLLEAVSKPCLQEVTQIELYCEDIVFKAKGAIVKDKGWKALFDVKDEQQSKEENQLFPCMEQGDFLLIESHNLVQKSTKAKPLYTEAGLLTAMETCGKEVEDQELRAALKDCGIGTPATRAGIIETLINREYIYRHERCLIPTKKGKELYSLVKSMRIADAEMTGSWEQALLKIERQPEYLTSFMGGIKVHVKQVVSEISSVILAANDSPQQFYVCPKCRLGRVAILEKVAKCSYSKCGFIVYRELCGKTISLEQVQALLLKGKTPLIKSFKNKMGRLFEAYIVLDKACKVVFRFPDKDEG